MADRPPQRGEAQDVRNNPSGRATLKGQLMLAF